MTRHEVNQGAAPKGSAAMTYHTVAPYVMVGAASQPIESALAVVDEDTCRPSYKGQSERCRMSRIHPVADNRPVWC